MTRAELMRFNVLGGLDGIDEEMRQRVIANVERFIGHSLAEAEPYERHWIKMQLRLYLQIEMNGEVHSQPDLQGELCPSCGQFDLIFENGCSRCISCGFGKCGL